MLLWRGRACWDGFVSLHNNTLQSDNAAFICSPQPSLLTNATVCVGARLTTNTTVTGLSACSTVTSVGPQSTEYWKETESNWLLPSRSCGNVCVVAWYTWIHGYNTPRSLYGYFLNDFYLTIDGGWMLAPPGGLTWSLHSSEEVYFFMCHLTCAVTLFCLSFWVWNVHIWLIFNRLLFVVRTGYVWCTCSLPSDTFYLHSDMVSVPETRWMVTFRRWHLIDNAIIVQW